MPFKIVKDPKKGYFVMDTNGKKYSKKPLSLARAKRQLAALHIHTGHGLIEGGIAVKLDKYEDGTYGVSDMKDNILDHGLTKKQAMIGSGKHKNSLKAVFDQVKRGATPEQEHLLAQIYNQAIQELGQAGKTRSFMGMVRGEPVNQAVNDRKLNIVQTASNRMHDVIRTLGQVNPMHRRLPRPPGRPPGMQGPLLPNRGFITGPLGLVFSEADSEASDSSSEHIASPVGSHRSSMSSESDPGPDDGALGNFVFPLVSASGKCKKKGGITPEEKAQLETQYNRIIQQAMRLQQYVKNREVMNEAMLARDPELKSNKRKYLENSIIIKQHLITTGKALLRSYELEYLLGIKSKEEYESDYEQDMPKIKQTEEEVEALKKELEELGGSGKSGSGYYQDELQRRMQRFPEHIANPIIQRTLPKLEAIGPSRANLLKGRLFGNPQRQQRKHDIIDHAINEAQIATERRRRRRLPIGSTYVTSMEDIANNDEVIDYANNSRSQVYHSPADWEAWRVSRAQLRQPFNDPYSNVIVNPRNIERFTAEILPKEVGYKKYREGKDTWYQAIDDKGNPIGEPSWEKPPIETGQEYRPREPTIDLSEPDIHIVAEPAAQPAAGPIPVAPIAHPAPSAYLPPIAYPPPIAQPAIPPIPHPAPFANIVATPNPLFRGRTPNPLFQQYTASGKFSEDDMLIGDKKDGGGPMPRSAKANKGKGLDKTQFVKKYLKGQGLPATKKNVAKVCDIMDSEGIVFEGNK